MAEFSQKVTEALGGVNREWAIGLCNDTMGCAEYVGGGITPANRDDSIRTLFADTPDYAEQFIAYLGARGGLLDSAEENAQSLYNDMPEDLQQFAKLYDDFMARSMNPNAFGGDNFNAYTFSAYVSDGVIEGREFCNVISRYGFTEKLKEMPPAMARKWVQFTKDVVHGYIGANDNGAQYHIDEFSGLYSPPATEKFNALANDSLFPTLKDATGAMTSFCSTGRGEFPLQASKKCVRGGEL